MAWFHPKSLLDKTYEIGLFVKGIDGSLELLGGLLLIVIPKHAILQLTDWLTHNELADDPHDFLANHILKAGHNLASNSHLFAILFLLTHGAIKVGLVLALLRQKLWAYPWALVVLTLFLIYQIYLLVVRTTISMAFLTVLDAIIIWLVWREWHKVKGEPKAQPVAD